MAEFAYRSPENFNFIPDYKKLYNFPEDFEGDAWLSNLCQIDITDYFPYVFDMEKFNYLSFDNDRVFWRLKGGKVKSAIFNSDNITVTLKYALELINATNADIQKL